MTRAGVAVSIVVVGAALLMACEDRDGPDRRVATTEDTPAPTPPPTPVGSPTPTTTPSPEPTCSNEDEVVASTALRGPGVLTGDVDGDGTLDRAFIAVDPSAPAGCRAFVGVETPAVVVSAPVTEEDIPVELGLPRLNILAPIDGVTGLDVVVDITAGASTQYAGVFSVSEGDLARVTVEGDDPATDDLFAYGGSVGHVDAADCTEDGLVVTSTAVPRRGGELYDVVRTFHVPAGPTLQPDPSLTERATRTLSQLDEFPEFLDAPFAHCL